MNSDLIVNQNAAKSIVDRLRKKNKIIVFTNGCFDILHSGHAVYLSKARSLGDFLVVGLNSDSSVKRLKGSTRPIVKFKERALLLSMLKPVDLVVGFGDTTPLKLIRKLKPDILVKGADYKISEIVGAEDVKNWGGRIKRVKLVKGKSSSMIIDRLIKL